MRPMWIASRTASSDQTQPRSIGARSPSSASSWSPSARMPGVVGEAEIGDRGVARVAGREHGRRRDVPGRAGEPRGAGERDRPRERAFAHDHEHRRDGEVAERGEHVHPPERAAAPMEAAPDDEQVPRAVDRERPDEEQDEGGAGQEGRVDEQQPHADRQAAAEERAAAGHLGRAPEAVEDLDRAGDDEQDAHARAGFERRGQRTQRSQQRQAGDKGREPELLRGRRRSRRIGGESREGRHLGSLLRPGGGADDRVRGSRHP